MKKEDLERMTEKLEWLSKEYGIEKDQVLSNSIDLYEKCALCNKLNGDVILRSASGEESLEVVFEKKWSNDHIEKIFDKIKTTELSKLVLLAEQAAFDLQEAGSQTWKSACQSALNIYTEELRTNGYTGEIAAKDHKL